MIREIVKLHPILPSNLNYKIYTEDILNSRKKNQGNHVKKLRNKLFPILRRKGLWEAIIQEQCFTKAPPTKV